MIIINTVLIYEPFEFNDQLIEFTINYNDRPDRGMWVRLVKDGTKQAISSRDQS